MFSLCNKAVGIAVFIVMAFGYSGILHAQGAPIIGDAQVNTGGASSGEIGVAAIVPINIDLTEVTVVDVGAITVPAVLGNYRIAISYDNTLVKARNTGGLVPGGSTLEFSAPSSAHITTSGTSDTLIIMQTQLSNVSPTGLINVAQIEFDILSAAPTVVPLAIIVLDLRTQIIFPGLELQPVIGGESISSLITNGSINILAATDTDSDGIPDYWETANGFNPNDPADATQDSDGDGLTNLAEYVNNTDPHNPDSDNDLVPDGVEVASGNNPNDELDFPLWITSIPVTNGLELKPYQYSVIANYTGATYSLDLSPTGMSIDAVTGVIDWSPVVGQIGVINVTVRVTKDTDFATQDYVLNVIELGDVNIDGAVNITDYLLAQRHALGLITLDAQQVERADLYPATGGDAQITLSDLMFIIRKVMGID